MTKTRLLDHVFQRDPNVPPDHHDEPFCTCGAPRKHAAHRPDPTSPERAALEARLLGESET